MISSDDALDNSETEILEGLQAQGVTAVKRIIMRRDGLEEPTRHPTLRLKDVHFQLLSMPATSTAE